MKNIEKSKIISLAGMVEYCPGQIVSRTLAQNSSVSLTLFAFDKGEEISTHAAGGDALVTCLEGCGSVTIVMPAGHPHSVYGKERFKMFLTVVF